MQTVLSKKSIGIGFLALALIGAVLGIMLFSALGSSQVGADPSQPSAKATAKIGGIGIMSNVDAGPTVILSQEIKTPNGKDLFIDASLECGVYTRTKVQSKGGNKDTSTAHGIVELRALVDGDAALPGWVTFCSREQTLSAEFAGILQECVPVDSTEDLAADITATDLTLTYTGADVFSVGDLIRAIAS